MESLSAINGMRTVLHPWLQQELTAVLDQLPAAPPVTDAAGNHAAWQAWQQGLQNRITLPALLPQLRLLLVWDNLKVWPPGRTCRDLAGLEMLMGFGLQTWGLQPIPA
ncbi:MAG: hypothetical protein Q7T29_17815 [Gallionella sp.]|nr:hypothetical protein [Gallionella sp.]